MVYEELLALVKKRRTFRKFKPGRIPDEDIDKIIEVARWAPSGFNTQPWDFVVVKRDDLREKIIGILQENLPPLSKEAKDTPANSGSLNPVDKLVKRILGTKGVLEPFYDAPVFIILYGDPRARVGLPPGERTKLNEHYKFIFDASLANAFMYMHLAAASLGIAAQWWTRIRVPEVQAKIKPLLGVPDELVAFDMMVLGYPGAVSRPKLLRPKHKMVHIDDCGAEDYRTDEEVRDFAKRTRAWTIGQHRRACR
ncbi:MAG: nitroreductase family protein [Deltaproteobacteria bacterium]|jgi:nitroreductase